MRSSASESRSSPTRSRTPDRRSSKEIKLSTPTPSATSRRERRAARREELRSQPRSARSQKTSARSPLALISIIAAIGAVLFAVVLLAQAPPAPADTTDTAVRAPTTARAPGLLLDGRAIGSPDAPVVVEIWEDFQCPACSRFTQTVEPSVVERFVPSGDVRVVYRDFAFLGTESIDAAVAARCAGEQGAFWSYHDWLYANQNGENAGWFS